MIEIIVPQPIADEIIRENQRKEKEVAARQRAESLRFLKLELQARVPQIYLKVDAKTVRQLCKILLNTRAGTVFCEPLSLPEVGSLISDVLLGDGQQYEIKT